MNLLLDAFAHGHLDQGDYDELIDLIHRQEAEGPLLAEMDKILEELASRQRVTREEEAQSEALFIRMMKDARMQPTRQSPRPTAPRIQPATGPTAPLFGLRRASGLAGSAERPSVLRRAPWLAAAGVVLALGVALAIRQVNARRDRAAASLVAIRTALGERRMIRLPDSSVVWLNAGSRLSYEPGLAGATEQAGTVGAAAARREITLEGEAYFEVKDDPAKPFVVNTGGMRTVVLGTAFDINAYDPSRYTVTVTQGKVKVDDKTGEIARLTKDKQLQFIPATGESSVGDVSGAELIAWKNGELVFDNISMADAADIIGRWFGVRFQFRDSSIRQDRFSVSFLKGENVRQVMDIIGTLNNFPYTIENGTILAGQNK